jgi:hypothetical protein
LAFSDLLGDAAGENTFSSIITSCNRSARPDA